MEARRKGAMSTEDLWRKSRTTSGTLGFGCDSVDSF